MNNLGFTYTGETETTTAAIRSAGGELEDPVSLTLLVLDPNGVQHTHTYGTDAFIVRDGVGIYHFDQLYDVPGDWTWTWVATGEDLQTQSSGAQRVLAAPSQFVIVVQNQHGSPIEGVQVDVFLSDEVTLRASGQSNVDGAVFVTLEQGQEFVAELSSAQNVTVPKKIEFVADETPVFFDVTSLDVAPIDPSRSVFIYGYIEGSDASRIATRVVVETHRRGNASMVNGGSQSSGVEPANVGIAAYRRDLRSNPKTGFWGTSFAAGARIRVTIPVLGYVKTFTVPDDERVVSLNIRDAVALPGPDGIGIDGDTPGYSGARTLD